MAYIGAEPVPGQNREVDDISSGFNGNATAFTLQVSSVNVSPESANNILINLGGVLQNPGTDYTIAASTITFTTAPAAGLSFFGLILGAGINTATVADGAITTAKLASDAVGANQLANTSVTAGSYTTADITVDAQGRITAAASGTISGAEIADQAVTNAKVNNSAAIAVSKLENFVANNADNRIITGSGTTNTLNAESEFTFDGSNIFCRAGEGASASLNLIADQGDDNGDGWKIQSEQDENDLTFKSNLSGSYVDKLKLKSSGQLEVQGNLEVSGTITPTGNVVIPDTIVHTGDSNTKIRFPAADTISFETGGSEGFRMDSSQRILVSTNSANSIATKLISKCVAGTSATWAQCGLAITHASGANRKSLIGLGFSGNGGTNPPAAIGSVTHNTSSFEKDALVFYTRDVTTDTEPTERMRITPFGTLQVSNSGSFAATDPTYHDFSANSSNDLILRLRNTSSNNPYGLRIIFDNAAPNDTTRYFIQCVDNAAVRFEVKTNGGIHNFSANNSNLCDEREKKNIVSLDTKWDKVKSWELKKFHYNEDADTDALRYGVIAQQVEEHCPEVLTEWIKQKAEDAVLDEDGNVVKEAVAEIERKGVKEQQMMWMAIKALQEAQTRIETLETKVAALEAA